MYFLTFFFFYIWGKKRYNYYCVSEGPFLSSSLYTNFIIGRKINENSSQKLTETLLFELNIKYVVIDIKRFSSVFYFYFWLRWEWRRTKFLTTRLFIHNKHLNLYYYRTDEVDILSVRFTFTFFHQMNLDLQVHFSFVSSLFVDLGPLYIFLRRILKINLT